MKVPKWLAVLIVGAGFTLQGWTLAEVNRLGKEVAGLSARMGSQQIASTQSKYETQNTVR